MIELIGDHTKLFQSYINTGIWCKLFLSDNSLLDPHYNHNEVIEMRKELIENANSFLLLAIRFL